ncbi:helix-turn-helix domain-containing protein [Paenibacillus thiaminolyticus]|uniref:helix-turn-helix domain-containing protein n=1 Tax=Paenibacillus thiaminolyticus TaxID=49283 RepID=UPI001F0F7411|nr:helix-turn-helix domain-containing protein [Paenibacillus thiaminolyticus]
MTEHAHTSVPLRSLLFHLSNIELIARPVGWTGDIHTENNHSLLIFTSGSGSLAVDGRPFHFGADKCYLLAPGNSARISNGYDNAVRFYRLAFAAIRAGLSRHTDYTGSLMPERYELAAYPFSRLIRIVDELYAGRLHRSDLESFRRQLRFQELLRFLFEQNFRSEHAPNPAQSVENTIGYLQSNYGEPITVRQLAEMARLPQWQYTALFQELTGKKPLDYVTELRINSSKQLLIASQDPLREIARQVGFSDEYYFNRRFRQTTGVTPRQYARSMRSRTRVTDRTGHEVEIPARPERIFYYGETLGDLLALGVDAIGGHNRLSNHFLFQDRFISVADVGHPINPDKVMGLNPDLIIFANADERQYSRISRIAPTVTFNSFAPLEHRLHTLGSWLGKKREADEWLRVYHARAAAAWQRLSPLLTPGETASVFIYEHGRRLFVMGMAGFSSPCTILPAYVRRSPFSECSIWAQASRRSRAGSARLRGRPDIHAHFGEFRVQGRDGAHDAEPALAQSACRAKRPRPSGRRRQMERPVAAVSRGGVRSEADRDRGGGSALPLAGRRKTRPARNGSEASALHTAIP